MVGSETTTSPRVVMPNRYCWPLVASNATRSGPMIGSRMEIFFCWLKKNVSNTRMLVSGDAVNTMRSAMFPEPPPQLTVRSEEHTSELQSRLHLVCRLLLEKKKLVT